MLTDCAIAGDMQKNNATLIEVIEEPPSEDRDKASKFLAEQIELTHIIVEFVQKLRDSISNNVKKLFGG
ncbi:hypothetical protein L1987_17736 [Smallanthus sonchifolius]|uniref:Uncharacterized protein n=1 Tax=Smallanthus sonchifolius TaxID=185202 RepID=A0ACB9IXT5_9ASTR|nr:hypothetical protein L1987_17736 [Smallanthus sonchifolius]